LRRRPLAAAAKPFFFLFFPYFPAAIRVQRSEGERGWEGQGPKVVGVRLIDQGVCRRVGATLVVAPWAGTNPAPTGGRPLGQGLVGATLVVTH